MKPSVGVNTECLHFFKKSPISDSPILIKIYGNLRSVGFTNLENINYPLREFSFLVEPTDCLTPYILYRWTDDC
jgi:RsiW-degrading membrane proteinase PrsW (M82 family)